MFLHIFLFRYIALIISPISPLLGFRVCGSMFVYRSLERTILYFSGPGLARARVLALALACLGPRPWPAMCLEGQAQILPWDFKMTFSYENPGAFIVQNCFKL